MSGFNIVSRLPAYFRTTPAFLKVSQLIEKSAVRFSGLFISIGGENHLLLKDGSIHIQYDWQAYSLLRASSHLLIGSGAILRSEPGLFKAREAYGNPNVESLNQSFIGTERQKTFFFTRSLSHDQLRAFVDEKLYEVVNPPPYNSVYEAIQQLHTPENFPMTVEVGLELLNQYFQSVDDGKKNKLDTLLISKYEGQVQQRLIGPKFSVPVSKYYNLQWKSQPFPCQLSNNQKGVLTFEVYISK